MNRQEMFNKIWEGFEGQNWVISEDGHGTCMYRAPNGAKCAIGHLISEEEYDEQMEHLDVKTALKEGLLPLRFSEDIDFLFEIQKVHDQYVWSDIDSEEWLEERPTKLKDSMKNFAVAKGLQFPKD